MTTPDAGRAATRLQSDIDRWLAAGLLTAAQAEGIAAYEGLSLTAPPAGPAVIGGARSRRVPVVAEALGYLGGALAIVGLVVLVVQAWPDMATAARLALVAAGAVAFAVGGALVPARSDPALARFRGFLWLVSSAATALFAGVLAADGLGASERIVAAAYGAAAAAHGGALWRWRDRPVQQLTCLAGIVFAIGPVAAWATTDGVDGIAMLAVGAIYVAGGMRRRTPSPMLTVVVGTAALLFGTTIAMVAWPGAGGLIGVAAGFALLASAALPNLPTGRSERILLGTAGGLLLVLTVPGTLGYFTRDAGLATGLVTWAIGAAVVAVGARQVVHLPMLALGLGGATLLGGAALTSVQVPGFGPLFGIATAGGLIALGMLPRQVLLSVLGSVGLLVNVPWAIGHFFPGEGRAPLLIMVTGGLIIAIAVLLTRSSGRLRHDIGGAKRRQPPFPHLPA